MECKECTCSSERLLREEQVKTNEFKNAEGFELRNSVVFSNEIVFNSYSLLGAFYEKARDFINAKEVYKKAIAKAKEMHDKTWEREFSYALLGLVD